MEKLQKIISKYIDSTIKHGIESESGNFKEANKYYKAKSKCFEEIKSYGQLGQLEIIKLLSHMNGHVRVGAAFHTLSFQPNLGEKILDEAIEEPDGIGFKAKMILSEWRKGNLTF